MRTVLIVLVLTLQGCMSQADLDSLAKAKVEAEQAAVQARLGGDIPAAERAEAAAARVDALMDDRALADTIDGVSTVVAPFTGPYGQIYAVVSGLVVGLFRSWQQKRKGLAIATAIERSKVNGVVDFKNSDSKRELDKMGDGAKAIVNEAQGGRATSPV